MSETESEWRKLITKSLSKEQCKDTGLAMILILLLLGYFTGNVLFYKLSVPVLILIMVTPGSFYPLAVLWFSLSTVLGTIMSKVILTLVYFLIVVPIATIRRLAGIDSLKLNQFKKGTESVMVVRNHIYTSDDIEKPY
jgi:hypothetical protein